MRTKSVGLTLVLLVAAACGNSSKSPPPAQDAAAGKPDAAPAPTPEALRALVDSAAKPLVDGGWTPALAIALVDAQGDQLYTYGSLDDAATRPVDADSLFEIGSLTKTFTAIVLAQLVQNGVVKLDEPVEALLPKGTAVPRYENKASISLLDLATHYSSLPRIPDLATGDPQDPYAGYDTAKLYAFLARYTLPYAPGQRFDYSNLGYGLLGHALALRAGIAYPELVVDGIARPLGMGATTVGVPAEAAARMAQGHDASGEPVPAWRFDVLAPAGAIVSSVKDMARYLRAQLDLLPDENAKRLRAAIDLTQFPRAARPGGKIGLGWLTDEDGLRFTMSGQTGGFYSVVMFDRKSKQGMIVLASGTSDQVEKLATYVWSAWHGGKVEPPRVAATPALDAAALDAYAGEYRIDAKITVKVWREGHHLRAQPTGQAPDSVWPTGPDKFHLRKADANLAFERDASGAVVALELIEDAGTQRAPRLAKPSTPTKPTK
jgi:D-alanyl-D-alanine-carboxypeptidase/D-alanyl-D-alanine-endopeptidase